MKQEIKNINKKDILSKKDIISLLKCNDDESVDLFNYASSVRDVCVGDKVFLRGLIEYSNICSKDCLYCGIRKSSKQERYSLNEKQVLEQVKFSLDNNLNSFVIQSGEMESPVFTDKIDSLLRKINQISNGNVRVTLSCGEQTAETYKRWFESGAHRYLLRIETSNKELYYKIHPNDEKHDFEKRLHSLYTLQDTGYQTGTGVMIGLPFQTIDDLAEDLLFMKELDIDMCGMGPFIEHENTPLWQYKDILISEKARFNLSLKMIAILRIMLKDINIAASTAMEALDENGKKKAIEAGANVVMPNITPKLFRKNYKLYYNKPYTDDDAFESLMHTKQKLIVSELNIAAGEYGDSVHYKQRNLR